MQPAALRIIEDEHLAISAVVYSLRYLARQLREPGRQADFRLLRAILDYIVAYPDRWHHPKENDYLFAILRVRQPRAVALIEELESEHLCCEALIDELQRKLLGLEHGTENALPEFIDTVERYAQFHWDHMRKEEDRLMPMAQHALSDQDWQQIAAAFREHDNPLFGIRPKEQADSLLQKILSLAPAPIGRGTCSR